MARRVEFENGTIIAHRTLIMENGHPVGVLSIFQDIGEYERIKMPLPVPASKENRATSRWPMAERCCPMNLAGTRACILRKRGAGWDAPASAKARGWHDYRDLGPAGRISSDASRRAALPPRMAA